MPETEKSEAVKAAASDFSMSEEAMTAFTGAELRFANNTAGVRENIGFAYSNKIVEYGASGDLTTPIGPASSYRVVSQYRSGEGGSADLQQSVSLFNSEGSYMGSTPVDSAGRFASVDGDSANVRVAYMEDKVHILNANGTLEIGSIADLEGSGLDLGAKPAEAAYGARVLGHYVEGMAAGETGISEANRGLAIDLGLTVGVLHQEGSILLKGADNKVVGVTNDQAVEFKADPATGSEIMHVNGYASGNDIMIREDSGGYAKLQLGDRLADTAEAKAAESVLKGLSVDGKAITGIDVKSVYDVINTGLSPEALNAPGALPGLRY